MNNFKFFSRIILLVCSLSMTACMIPAQQAESNYSSDEYTKDPNLVLLGLLINKDYSDFMKENSLYENLKADLTRLICVGPILITRSSEEYTEEEKIPENMQYFAFNDQYFFKRYQSKWILLDDAHSEGSSFQWGYHRGNKPLGGKDISFLSEDINTLAHLGYASETLFINRETGNFYSKFNVEYIYTGEGFSAEYSANSEGVCKLPGEKKF